MDHASLLLLLADVFEVDAKDLSEQTPLTSDNWDSLAMLGVIALVDEHFERTVPTNDLKQCSSVGDLLHLIDRVAAE
jgi:acyl carrier protein